MRSKQINAYTHLFQREREQGRTFFWDPLHLHQLVHHRQRSLSPSNCYVRLLLLIAMTKANGTDAKTEASGSSSQASKKRKISSEPAASTPVDAVVEEEKLVVKDEVGGVEDGMEVDFSTADKEAIGSHIKDWQSEVNSLEHLVHHLYEHAVGNYTSDAQAKGEATWKEHSLDLEFHLASAPDTIFKAHSFIIACRSNELETQIQQCVANGPRPWVIQVPAEIPADIFPEFLRFLYTFKCEITPSNVSALLLTADHYQVRSLRKACGEFLYAQVQVKEENVFEILTNAMDFHLDDIKERCMDIIQKNTSVFTDKAIFSKMKPQHLEEIVKFNILPLNEEKLFEFIVKWSAYMKDPVVVTVPEAVNGGGESEGTPAKTEAVEGAAEGEAKAEAKVGEKAVEGETNGEAEAPAEAPAAEPAKPTVITKRVVMRGEELKALLVNVLPYIRFPVMTAEFFVDTVVPLKVLSMEDEWAIFQDIASKKATAAISRFPNDPREQVKAAFKVSIEAGKSKTSTLHTKRLKWSFSFFTKPHRFYREYNYEYCRVCRQNPRHECYYYNMEVTVENIANAGKDRKDAESWQCELESLEVRLLYPTHRTASVKGGDVKPAESSGSDAAAAPQQKSKTIYGPVSWKFDENKALFKVQELVDCHYYHPEHTDGIFLDRGFLYMEVIFKAKDKTTL